MLRRFLAALLILDIALGKVVDGVVRLSSQDTEQYISKFSFSPYATP